jgi:hypothetical protein
MNSTLVMAILFAISQTAFGDEPLLRGEPESVTFVHDGYTECKISFSTNVSERPRQTMMQTVRRFQIFIERLTGVNIPIKEIPPGGRVGKQFAEISAGISITASVTPRDSEYAYRIGLVQPDLTSDGRPCLYIITMPDWEGEESHTNVLFRTGNLEKAIDALV